MAFKFQHGFYTPINPEKYVGSKPPYMRSSWERKVMELFDMNPNFIRWASEPVRIPYKNPFTGAYTVYVPDFLVTYKDVGGNEITELIEVKPAKEAILAYAKSTKAKAAFVLNQYKWEAAKAYAKSNGINFRIMTEFDIYNNPKGKA